MTPDELQFDFMDGVALKDAGIDTVLAHNPTWLMRVYQVALEYVLQQQEDFTGEDIRYACRRRIENPSHPNAWGGLINRLVKNKDIIPTGRYRRPKDKISHARLIQIYRKR